MTYIIKLFSNKYSNELLNPQGTSKRTPLTIAGVLPSKRLCMLLLCKGASPAIIDSLNSTTFHYVLEKGEYECLLIILNYLKINKLKDLFINLYKIKHEFGYKNVEISNGILLDNFQAQNPEHQQKFASFMDKISSLF